MNARRFRWLFALTLAVATPMVTPFDALAGGHGSTGPKACRVWNATTRTASSDLQSAIDAATSGDTLRVRGMCAGNFTIAKDLRLVGPATLNGETCDGPYCSRGIVLWVDTGIVTLKHMRIVNGSSTFTGGGIQNYGTLIIKGRSSVTGNLAEDGAGGIYNFGTLVMSGSASVRDNSLLGGQGGGIWNVGTLVMKERSSVTGNSAQEGGGIFNEGTVIMKGRSSVTGNTADMGGGILNFNEGTVRFSPRWHGTVCGNTPDDWPGCQGS